MRFTMTKLLCGIFAVMCCEATQSLVLSVARHGKLQFFLFACVIRPEGYWLGIILERWRLKDALLLYF